MSGLYGTPGKRVYRKVPGVRIPPSPQKPQDPYRNGAWGFSFYRLFALKRSALLFNDI
jgi:hypothetical protein